MLKLVSASVESITFPLASLRKPRETPPLPPAVGAARATVAVRRYINTTHSTFMISSSSRRDVSRMQPEDSPNAGFLQSRKWDVANLDDLIVYVPFSRLF